MYVMILNYTSRKTGLVYNHEKLFVLFLHFRIWPIIEQNIDLLLQQSRFAIIDTFNTFFMNMIFNIFMVKEHATHIKFKNT